MEILIIVPAAAVEPQPHEEESLERESLERESLERKTESIEASCVKTLLADLCHEESFKKLCVKSVVDFEELAQKIYEAPLGEIGGKPWHISQLVALSSKAPADDSAGEARSAQKKLVEAIKEFASDEAYIQRVESKLTKSMVLSSLKDFAASPRRLNREYETMLQLLKRIGADLPQETLYELRARVCVLASESRLEAGRNLAEALGALAVSENGVVVEIAARVCQTQAASSDLSQANIKLLFSSLEEIVQVFPKNEGRRFVLFSGAYPLSPWLALYAALSRLEIATYAGPGKNAYQRQLPISFDPEIAESYKYYLEHLRACKGSNAYSFLLRHGLAEEEDGVPQSTAFGDIMSKPDAGSGVLGYIYVNRTVCCFLNQYIPNHSHPANDKIKTDVKFYMDENGTYTVRHEMSKEKGAVESDIDMLIIRKEPGKPGRSGILCECKILSQIFAPANKLERQIRIFAKLASQFNRNERPRPYGFDFDRISRITEFRLYAYGIKGEPMTLALKAHRADELYRIWAAEFDGQKAPPFGVFLIDVKQDSKHVDDRSSRKGLASFLASPIKDIERIFVK
ncbi:MAG: hypothetical protein LBC41_18115 [Clostridiales bacterium]|nr:hypothetical protein [Clostridiales bacterium]